MRVSFFLSAVTLGLLCSGPALHGQQATGAANVLPATKNSPAIQAGDRAGAPLGSAAISPSDTSAYPPYTPRDLFLGAGPDSLYPPEAVPPTPPGMLAHSAPGDPAMVYFTLPHRSGDNLLPADAAIVAARQDDLIRAAAYRGYDLHAPGWLYQQGICPQLQPSTLAPAGFRVPAQGPGFLLLHFVRHEGDRVSSFTAIVPRDSREPVRTIAVAHGSVEQHQDFLSVDTTGAVVNEAMPPHVLSANLEPFSGWIAASACIAEMGGAYPHIPNEASLSSEITIAPSPLLRLGLHGEREVSFTDRIDKTHYVVWDEQISNAGKMIRAHRDQVTVHPYAVTNPPVPAPVVLGTIPEPLTKITPYPPSPASSSIR
jgi:hypothetical protein